MDNLQMDEKLARLRRCRREMDTLKQEAEAIEAEVKAELEARGVEQVETAHYKVSWKAVSSTRLDAKALKAGIGLPVKSNSYNTVRSFG